MGQIKLSLKGSTFSGTIDLQVSADGTSWVNIPYFRSDTAPLGSLNTDQISLVGSSETRSYVVPGGPFSHFRVVMVRTAGTITASLEGYEHDSPLARRRAGQSYTVSNITTDRTYDADSTSDAEVADVLGTLIADLKTAGILD